ncbi:MAG: hypothetical protein KA144_10090 [Xanthomonadaceae bacterium]|nr:hypothetical protein [Xanthomonadaceae bacterium]
MNDEAALPSSIATSYGVSVLTIDAQSAVVFESCEREPERTVRKFRTVHIEGEREALAKETNG